MSDTIKQVIVVRKDLNMRKGKIAAQVAHASMKFLLDGASIAMFNGSAGSTLSRNMTHVQTDWVQGLFTKVVVSCDSEDELRELILRAKMSWIVAHPIIDSGLTEFHGIPTLTCAAFGPERSSLLDPITGHLKLL
jgi:PTH2 family peptidyl-tRNA hydrolase